MAIPKSKLSPADGGLEFLSGGGEMARVIATKDWSQSALGAIETGSQSLRTTVSLCLASNFPISLAWGPERTQIYNDAYRVICGAKHPGATGQDFRRCWASAWPAIGDAFESAERGETRFLENQRMFLDRNGYLEETFFTFSFSPIRDEYGLQGLFHPVTETSASMLNERRTHALRDVASRTHECTSVETACTTVMEVLSGYEFDVPWCLLYLPEKAGGHLRLAGCAGVKRENLTYPTEISGDGELAGRLLAGSVSGEPISVELTQALGVGAAGPYPEPAVTAMVRPVLRADAARHAGLLIAGISPRLPLTEAYRSFLELLAAQVTTAITTARAYEEERQRAAALADLDRAKTAFFSSVSHEFRTPLTLMLGPLEELLSRWEAAPERREQLELVYRNALRLLRLVNSLLDFSRVEAGRAQALFRPVNLTALTVDVSSVFRSAIEKAGIRFVVKCEVLSAPVFVDRQMWETILLNLLSNALKFTFNGEIRVILREAGGEVMLRIEDTGTGIPASELPRLFDRFYRVEGARGRTFEGSGIGLALVQELVRMHGGEVRVESSISAGSSFCITLPFGFAHLANDRIGLAPAGADEASEVRQGRGFVDEAMRWVEDEPEGLAVARKPDREQPGGRRGRVLLADDNADMRRYVERLLTADYDVECVSNGAEALAHALSKPPDIVLSDVMMPELDGFGLLAALRADTRTHLIPVILLSARAGEEARTEGIGTGADDYLVKPFSARELLARVRNRIELSEARAELHKQEDLRRHAEVIERQWKLFDVALSHTPDHVYIYDLEARFIYANRAVLELWGKPFAEWTGKSLQELGFPEDVAATVSAHVAHVIASGETVRHEVKVTDRGGEELSFEYIFAPVRDGDGRVLAIAGSSRDNTERKKAEERLQLVAEAAPSAMVMVGPDGLIHFANGQTERLFGYTRTELLGETVEMLIPQRFRSMHTGQRAAFFAAPAGRAMGAGRDLFGLRKDGSEVPLEIGLNPITTANGRFVLAAIIDVSARYEFEREREKMIGQLKRSLEEKTILIQEVQHRVGNNLALVGGLLQMQIDDLPAGADQTPLLESQRRFRSMALVQNHIDENAASDRVQFGRFLHELVADICFSHGRSGNEAMIAVQAAEIDIPLACAVPCGLILNELFGGILEGVAPDVGIAGLNVSFSRLDSGELNISIQESGLAIQGYVDGRNPRALSSQLVDALVRQIGGRLIVERDKGGGRLDLCFRLEPE